MMGIKIREIKAFRPPCDASSEMVNVKAVLDRDVSFILPYVKGALGNVRYFPRGPFIKFVFKGHPVTVDHDCVAIAGFPDDAAAIACAREVIALLEDIERKKESIAPDAAPYDPPTVMDIFKILPKKAGCGRCGNPCGSTKPRSHRRSRPHTY
ncbi:MAG: hypothetical protein ABIJ56_00725 [Pseudomonadota bacterium]